MDSIAPHRISSRTHSIESIGCKFDSKINLTPSLIVFISLLYPFHPQTNDEHAPSISLDASPGKHNYERPNIRFKPGSSFASRSGVNRSKSKTQKRFQSLKFRLQKLGQNCSGNQVPEFVKRQWQSAFSWITIRQHIASILPAYCSPPRTA